MQSVILGAKMPSINLGAKMSGVFPGMNSPGRRSSKGCFAVTHSEQRDSCYIIRTTYAQSNRGGRDESNHRSGRQFL